MARPDWHPANRPCRTGYCRTAFTADRPRAGGRTAWTPRFETELTEEPACRGTDGRAPCPGCSAGCRARPMYPSRGVARGARSLLSDGRIVPGTVRRERRLQPEHLTLRVGHGLSDHDLRAGPTTTRSHVRCLVEELSPSTSQRGRHDLQRSRRWRPMCRWTTSGSRLSRSPEMGSLRSGSSPLQDVSGPLKGGSFWTVGSRPSSNPADHDINHELWSARVLLTDP